MGVHFQNPALLRLALTHRSFVSEAAGIGYKSNERLEFLGDSVLHFISVDFLYHAFPELNEGQLTDMHAALGKTETLANFAKELELGTYLLLGKGDRHTGNTQAILENTFEAILGAIYLDQGIEAVKRFLIPRLESVAHEIVKNHSFKDFKSLFQELAQEQVGITPSYRLVNQEGPSHDRVFTVEVLLGETVTGRGQGNKKKSAEQEAAKAALLDKGWATTS